MRTNQEVERLVARIRELEGNNRQLGKDLRTERRLRVAAEERAKAAEDTADAYLVVTDDGGVIPGGSKSRAIAKALESFRSRKVHTCVVNAEARVIWESRQRGYVRRPNGGAQRPKVPV